MARPTRPPNFPAQIWFAIPEDDRARVARLSAADPTCAANSSRLWVLGVALGTQIAQRQPKQRRPTARMALRAAAFRRGFQRGIEAERARLATAQKAA